MYFNPAHPPAQAPLPGIASYADAFSSGSAAPVSPASAPSGGPGAPGAGFLGIYTKSSSPPPLIHGAYDHSDFKLTPGSATRLFNAKGSLLYPESRLLARAERFILLAAARLAIPHSRTAGCMHHVTKGSTCVPVVVSKRSQRAAFKNLQVCGSVWQCPVCAAKISEQRRTELTQIVAGHRATGGFVYLVTRTFPHGSNDRLIDLMAKLKLVEENYRNGAPWLRYTARFGVVGYARAVECTYGRHGWHPHIHELLFTTTELDLDDLKLATHARWSTVCEKSGLGTPSFEHGVDVRDGAWADKYLGKWGLESEMTKGHVKKGRDESLSPFDLLRLIAQSLDSKVVNQAKGLFRQYCEAFRGKRQLVISPSLKKYLVEPELSDEELAKQLERDAMTLGLLSLDGWKIILARQQRAQVLEAAGTGQWTAVLRLLDEIRGSAPLATLTVPLPLAPGETDDE
jgi:hypothetical protein